MEVRRDLNILPSDTLMLVRQGLPKRALWEIDLNSTAMGLR